MGLALLRNQVSQTPSIRIMPSSPRRRFERAFVALLVLCDLVVCAAAVALAYLVRAHLGPEFLAPLRHPAAMYVTALPVILALWLIVFASLGMYEPRRTLAQVAARGADFRAVSIAVLMIAATSFLSHRDYSRLILLQFWAFGLILTWFARSILGRYHRDVLASGRVNSRALIVGTGDLGRIVLTRLREHNFGFEPVGFVASSNGRAAPLVILSEAKDLASNAACGRGEVLRMAHAACAAQDDNRGIDNEETELPILGTVADLPQLISEHNIDEVLVADPAVPAGELMGAIGESERHGVEFLIIAGPLQVLTAQTALTGPADLPVLELRRPSFGPEQRVIKRAADLLLASILILLTSPLLAGIALAIRRQTGESALFLQKRVGLRGREFVMFKFRTMLSDSEAYAPSPEDPNDERITPIGRWLRKYSLDELPQLFNVLRGEMSIVGPRPEMPFMVEQYEPWQRQRLDVLPGMTGLWQILGRKDLPLRDNIEYDFYYIRNQSLLLDLAIFLRTLPIVVWGKGAY
jgi:lipopolysaccharide/colanic/teichoic acid biosynthesis glycosyltransferase